MNLVEELRWRGLLQDIMPGTEELLNKETVTGYVGFDPTADSLHIGNMVPVMLLVHLQRAGHRPIALVGGATGMVGDPSGKSAERNLLDLDTLNYNLNCQRKQLEQFLDFKAEKNPAEIVNNYDWFKEFSFLGFIRDVGKHISVNYMMAKDSVKNRLENGMSFTEFSYQLIQGYDFFHLYKSKGVKLQMGGSDQWGNITTGTELIRRMDGGEAFALTAPLVKKADGTKFGKSESGNVWLDAKKTSPYKFYQFWLNTTDVDAENYIKVFTLLPQDEIEATIAEHKQAPHLRVLQKALAKDITLRVHGEAGYNDAVRTTELLFSKDLVDKLSTLSSDIILDMVDDNLKFNVSKAELQAGIPVTELLADKTGIFPSRGEARKMIQGGGVSINMQKITDPNAVIDASGLLQNSYLLVQKGKSNKNLLIAE
ncbi:tyrosine--tRNA ligase [Oscillatoria amoena NRMC-F 0135]|nr:tyrosine--tRNA ligase [Oscillatoria amoena NRMC-F 0135]